MSCTAYRKIGLVMLVALLGISLLGNGLLLRRCLLYYRGLALVRLDPASHDTFRPANEELVRAGPQEPRIVFFGDSRIMQWQPLPAVAGCRLINRGIGGQTTAQVLLRLEADVLRLQPRIAVIQVGINDLKLIGVFPERKEAILENCCRNIQAMAERLSAEGIQVVLLTIFPPGPVSLSHRAIWSDAIPVAVQEANRRLGLLAGPRVTVVDCDPILAQGSQVKAEYAADTLHLKAAAYEALSRRLVPVLVKAAGAARENGSR